MQKDVQPMSVAYLLAVADKTDISRHRNEEAVVTLIERGLIDDHLSLTSVGECVADEVMQTGRRAMACMAG